MIAVARICIKMGWTQKQLYQENTEEFIAVMVEEIIKINEAQS